jgi:hypothetical protein
MGKIVNALLQELEPELGRQLSVLEDGTGQNFHESTSSNAASDSPVGCDKRDTFTGDAGGWELNSGGRWELVRRKTEPVENIDFDTVHVDGVTATVHLNNHPITAGVEAARNQDTILRAKDHGCL